MSGKAIGMGRDHSVSITITPRTPLLQTLVQSREEKAEATLAELDPYFAFRPHQKYSFYTSPCVWHFALKGLFLVGNICQSHR